MMLSVKSSTILLSTLLCLLGAKTGLAAEAVISEGGTPTTTTGSVDLLCEDVAEEGTKMCQEWALAGEWCVLSCEIRRICYSTVYSMEYHHRGAMMMTRTTNYLLTYSLYCILFCILPILTAKRTSNTWTPIAARAVAFVTVETVTRRWNALIWPRKAKCNAENGLGMENGAFIVCLFMWSSCQVSTIAITSLD